MSWSDRLAEWEQLQPGQLAFWHNWYRRNVQLGLRSQGLGDFVSEVSKQPQALYCVDASFQLATAGAVGQQPGWQDNIWFDTPSPTTVFDTSGLSLVQNTLSVISLYNPAGHPRLYKPKRSYWTGKPLHRRNLPTV